MPTGTKSAIQPVTQAQFLKGLWTAPGIYSQPKGCLPRSSGMLLSKYGSLLTAKASALIEQKTMNWLQFYVDDYMQTVPAFSVATGAAGRTTIIQSREFALLQTTNNIPAPAAPTLASNLSGAGALVPGTTYDVEITAVDNLGGETTVSGVVSQLIAGGNDSILVTFTASQEAVGYMVYIRNPTGDNIWRAATAQYNAILLTLSAAPVQASTYVINTLGSFGAGLSIAPPVANTTKALQLYDMKLNQPGGGGGLNPFLIASYTPCATTPPNTNFNNGTLLGGGATGHPDNDAWQGNTSPISQLVPFNSKVIVALGNNHKVQVLDPVAETVADLTNNFSASIPNWAAATTIAVGDLLLPTVNNAGAFIFTAVQGGVTGGAVPGAFPQTQGQQVADGNVIWENTGQVNANPAPRGAAHAFAYAGALVLANTAPVDSADGLDGPNVLAFSDFNNQNSWNPRNRVVVAKADGQQIMGCAYFAIADTGILPTAGLIVFREQSLFIVFGFPPNEQVVQVQTDKGCISPRTIKFVPGLGLVRLTHLGWAAFDGVNDRLIDGPISNISQPTGTPEDADLLTLSYTGLERAALLTNPRLYACAINTFNALTAAIYCYDINLKAWTMVQPDWASGTFSYFGNNGIQGDAVTPLGVYIGDHTGKELLQWQASAGYCDFAIQTPAVFTGPDTKTYYRRLTIRGNAGDGVLANSITVTPYIDGIAQTPVTVTLNYIQSGTVPASAPYRFIAWTDINAEGWDAFATISGMSNKLVELTAFIWDVYPISGGIPVQLY